MPARPIFPLSRNPFCSFIILGILFLTCPIAFAEVRITPDTVKAPTFRTNEAFCYGPSANTHINLGFSGFLSSSITGESGKDHSFCTIGGGSGNKASIDYSTVAGGANNEAGGNYSTVGGGWYNKAESEYSTVCGGYSNRANGEYSTVGGGSLNTTAGDYSWVGGSHMKLLDTAHHTFVWGYSEEFESISMSNAFLIFPAGTAGKVGIGTPNPRHLLDLGSTIQSKKLAVYQGPDGNSFYGFGISSNTLEIYAGADEPDGPAMVVKKATGRVGIGTTDPGHLLEVNGSAAKPGGGSWSVSSDERLKDITGVYESGLNGILELKPVTFYYKEGNPRGLPSNEEYIGFVAQEVQDVFPEAVSEGPDGYLDFNMHPVNVAVVNAIKELKAENDNLKAENASLKREIEKIKKILGI